MSGPVSTTDVPPDRASPVAEACEVEITDSRQAQVGSFVVRRALPTRGRRSVGPWCFVDHMGPGDVTPDQRLDVGPHPHIGLQTLTWLLAGEVLHRDSLGSEQVIRRGQLNLMTSGHGVSHAEEGRDARTGVLHGVQLWIAQPSSTRDAVPAFEHHGALPQVELAAGAATVLVGELDGVSSPARRDTDHVGVDLDLRSGSTTLPLRRDYEHALVVLEGSASVGGQVVVPGRLAYLGTRRDELELHVDEPARLLLVGGVPFPEPILMWWNYVARTRDEIGAAHRSWSQAEDRFGYVASSAPRIDVGPPPWAAPR